ncbi:hypothetical protein RDWZM_005899 [Blomia tropicalis]|uniref:Transmembrane protein n=1 Tax=Blomia tropicalis TaxID=40697 RepID=A0A9Q0M6V4_BLOTA|nr:hypothetical protein RDWZM_005899 [Blomia tropicalis]
MKNRLSPPPPLKPKTKPPLCPSSSTIYNMIVSSTLVFIIILIFDRSIDRTKCDEWRLLQAIVYTTNTPMINDESVDTLKECRSRVP